MCKKLITLALFLIIIQSCAKEFEHKRFLESLFSNNSKVALEYKVKVYRNRFESFPVTILYKIKMEAESYELWQNSIEICNYDLPNYQFPFESYLIKFEAYDNLRYFGLPKWWDVKNIKTEIRAAYNIEEFTTTPCIEFFDAIILAPTLMGFVI